MTPVVLIGGGGHAKVVAAIVSKLAQFRIVGYTAPVTGTMSFGIPYLGDDDVLSDLLANNHALGAVLGIGIVRVDDRRGTLIQRLLTQGLSLPVVVSPSAVVNAEVVIEDGTVVMDGVVINPGARIGVGSIINTHATVEHDCKIGAFSHIAPGAVLCGGASVGSRSIIGARACVLPGVQIGDRCLVGAGATVISNLLDPGIYVGSPARRTVR